MPGLGRKAGFPQERELELQAAGLQGWGCRAGAAGCGAAGLGAAGCRAGAAGLLGTHTQRCLSGAALRPWGGWRRISAATVILVTVSDLSLSP